MAIEAIESETISLNTESPFIESLKDSEEAVTVYQDPGVHSGFARLIEEERLMRATTCHFRGVSLKEKCATLERLILSNSDSFIRDEGYLLMAKMVAPFDVQLAISFVEKIKSSEEKALGYLEVSKHQAPQEARKTLAQAKGGCGHALSPTLKIYEEEKRRGFPEAEKTFSILQSAYAKVQKEMRTVDLVLNLYSLLRLGEYAGQAEPSFSMNAVNLLRENAQKIVNGQFDQKEFKEDYPGEGGLIAWGQIVEMEAKCPYLESQLEEDFATFIQLLQSLKGKHPKNSDDYNFDIGYLIMNIASFRLDLAKRALEYIDDPHYKLHAMIEIFNAEAQLAGYNKERGFAPLERLFREEFSDEPSIALSLFSSAMDAFGLERAQPFLQSAKETVQGFTSFYGRQWGYGIILEVENKYDLESRKETLRALQVANMNVGHADSNDICAMIEAELSLLG